MWGRKREISISTWSSYKGVTQSRSILQIFLHRFYKLTQNIWKFYVAFNKLPTSYKEIMKPAARPAWFPAVGQIWLPQALGALVVLGLLVAGCECLLGHTLSHCTTPLLFFCSPQSTHPHFLLLVVFALEWYTVSGSSAPYFEGPCCILSSWGTRNHEFLHGIYSSGSYQGMLYIASSDTLTHWLSAIFGVSNWKCYEWCHYTPIQHYPTCNSNNAKLYVWNFTFHQCLQGRRAETPSPLL